MKKQRWHGKLRSTGKWILLGTITNKRAHEMMDEFDLCEIATDEGLCTLT